MDVLRAAAQVQDTTVQLAALIAGPSTNQTAEQIARLVTSALAVQVQTNASFSLSAPSQIQNVLTQAASRADIHLNTSIAEGAAQIIAEVNQLKDQAAALATDALGAAEEISRIQGLAQGSIADDLALVGANARAMDDALAANTGEALQARVTAAPVGDATGDETTAWVHLASARVNLAAGDGTARREVTVIRAEGNKGPVGLRIALSDGTARYADGDYPPRVLICNSRMARSARRWT